MKIQGSNGWVQVRILISLWIVCLLLPACIRQHYSTSTHRLVLLSSDDLKTHGVAFITPSTVTGQEEEKQAVASIFAEVLIKERPDLRCVTLPETLNAINAAGLADDYRAMYGDYRDTGLFKKDVLHKVGEVTNTRYVVQLKLSGFGQGSTGRLGVFGLRLLETKHATVRLFCQIWDTRNGAISWEGVEEFIFAVDTFTERNVTLKRVLEKAAKNMVDRFP